MLPSYVSVWLLIKKLQDHLCLRVFDPLTYRTHMRAFKDCSCQNIFYFMLHFHPLRQEWSFNALNLVLKIIKLKFSEKCSVKKQKYGESATGNTGFSYKIKAGFKLVRLFWNTWPEAAPLIQSDFTCCINKKQTNKTTKK